MIGIIFNHDMRDDPYNQNTVKKGFNKLETIADTLNERLYLSIGQRKDAFFQSYMEEYVIVQHTCELSPIQKRELAEAVNEILTLKKSAQKEYGNEKLIVFDKKSTEDCFIF